ncbi:hypothetical protein scyTo_0022940, partial [Scyliorhinus torazame]|nr:hypothetical protein [Scyliorhinus torazame]
VCCVVYNFKSPNPVCKKAYRVPKPGCVMLALPCVESPLEKLSVVQNYPVAFAEGT